MKPGPIRRRRVKPGRGKRRTPAEKARAAAWRAKVVASRAVCVCDSEVLAGAGFGDVVAHHIVTQQVLRRRARELELPPPVLLWDVRVGMPVSKRRHERHHSRHEPILRGELPAAVFTFARAYGLEAWLDRHYPVDADRPAV